MPRAANGGIIGGLGDGALAIVVGVALVGGPAPGTDSSRWSTGTTLGHFVLVGIGPKSVTIQDGEIRVTGRPDGYFATRESYKNYVLRFEWKYERPEGLTSEAAFQGNSGLLLHIAEPHKVWPCCVESSS